MPYVIACGDEGVQLNEGVRLGFVGAGFRLPSFTEVLPAVKTVFGNDIVIASSDENDWVKQTLGLHEWDQVNASIQQHIEALADREGLHYAGHLPFTDPKALEHGVKGHMVRPHGVHVANKICFTLGGGEQKYHLGCYVISADWVHAADPKVAKEVLVSQLEFYQALAKKPLQILFEEGGSLGEEIVSKNRDLLGSFGITAA